MNITIGKLTARIPGGDNYCDTIEVLENCETREYVILVKGCCPRGGMDGDPTPLWTQHVREVLPSDTSCKEILARVKVHLANENFLFKRYGKPTKHFTWFVEDHTVHGLSIKAVREATYRPEG